MNVPRIVHVSAVLLALTAAGCERDQRSARPAATVASTVDESPSGVDQEPVKLEEVLEITTGYVIGISYPQGEIRHPQLAAEMKRYADEQRAQFMDALEARDQEDGDKGMMYDLSLRFSRIIETPELAAYAVEGSSFTGGAHGTALMERFVWLPQQEKRLDFDELVPETEGREVVADFVREQLHTALSQRVDADDLPPDERSQLIANAGRMIDEGTAAEDSNFDIFEPVANQAGKLTALRFIFPPYQVGPYADGMQSVEVPASVLIPHIDPRYRGLFADA